MTGVNGTSDFFHTPSGTKTHYISYGNPSGPLLITLHGLGGSTETFSPLIPHLSLNRFRIISVDFEGFGKTALTDTPISVARHVADLDDLVAFLQGPESEQTTASTNNSRQPLVIIGHSLGSVIALHYAAKYPNNVAGLGLLGVGRSASHIEAVKQRMQGMAAKVRAEGIRDAADLATKTNFPEDATEQQMQEVWKAVAASDPEGYARTCEAMVGDDHVDPEYGRITCPTVFVTGEKDMISPPARAMEVSGLLGGKSVILVVRGGHQPVLSDLEGTVAALEKLFAMI